MPTPNVTPFNQPAPELGNQYDDDRVLRSYLRHTLPPDVLAEIEPELRALGERAGGDLYALQLKDRLNEPRLTRWDAWGERVDDIELTAMWQLAEPLAAEVGIIAIPYAAQHGALSRIHQFSLLHLFAPATDVYACPLAMTDGATRTLLDSGNQALIDRAVPHLTSRDPASFWTSGQWMTESTGGSDVGQTETVATKDADGRWRLYGRKWFTSAATSQMALTLARPEGNDPGGHGLALFFLETRDAQGRLHNIRVNRLKDKLGTRKVPTAELSLEGTPAELVLGPTSGVRNITPMLNITRTWNSVTAVAGMRRALALAYDFAPRRVAFGAPLSDKPLHVDTLADMTAEYEAAFQLSYFVVGLLGKREAGELDEVGQKLLRLVTPLAKLTTGKQAVQVASEVLESFGGAGYVEDTGLPVLLRDAQVLPIWEGTTNVLSLDTLRALARGGGLEELRAEVGACRKATKDASLGEAVDAAGRAVDHAAGWLAEAMKLGEPAVEAGARRFALTLGRSLSLALLARHAQWALDQDQDPRPRAAARRFQHHGIDQIVPADLEDAHMLVGRS